MDLSEEKMEQNKLWTFGDSFTAGILPDIDHFPPYKKYLKYLGIPKEEFPEGWGKQLSEKLGMDYETNSCGGSSNQEIFMNVSQNSNRFKKGDIVIINWTYLNRFLWGLDKDDYDENLPFGKFRRASVASSNDSELLKYASSDVYEKIGLNNSLDCWVETILSYENIIDVLSKSIGFEVFYWSSEHKIHTNYIDNLNQRKYIINDIIRDCIDYFINNDFIIESIPDELIFISMEAYGVTSISNECENQADDLFHRGIRGNEIQCELFYSWITNKKYPDKINEYKFGLYYDN